MGFTMNDQRVEVAWKVTQGDDWFRPFRVLDEGGVDVTGDCDVIVSARVQRDAQAAVLVAAYVDGPIVGGRWAGYHAIRADRADTAEVTAWGAADWEVEITPPGADLARTIVGGPLIVAPQNAVRGGGS